MPDLIFIDTETTGLEPSADIWEFAGIRRRADGISEALHLFIEHDWSKCAKLPESFLADHHARFPGHDLATKRLTAARKINEFVKASSVPDVAVTDKPVLIGSAPDFDAGMITRFIQSETSSWRPTWDHQLIGVVPLMLGYLAAKGMPIPAHKSEDLSRAIGVEPDDFERHTAMGDVLWTMAIYGRVMGADHA